MPILKEWSIIKSRRLVGYVYDHPKFFDGDEIITSPIEMIEECDEDKIIYTRSHTRYILSGPPNPEFLGILEILGLRLDMCSLTIEEKDE